MVWFRSAPHFFLQGSDQIDRSRVLSVWVTESRARDEAWPCKQAWEAPALKGHRSEVNNSICYSFCVKERPKTTISLPEGGGPKWRETKPQKQLLHSSPLCTVALWTPCSGLASWHVGGTSGTIDLALWASKGHGLFSFHHPWSPAGLWASSLCTPMMTADSKSLALDQTSQIIGSTRLLIFQTPATYLGMGQTSSEAYISDQLEEKRGDSHSLFRCHHLLPQWKNSREVLYLLQVFAYNQSKIGSLQAWYCYCPSSVQPEHALWHRDGREMGRTQLTRRVWLSINVGSFYWGFVM